MISILGDEQVWQTEDFVNVCKCLQVSGRRYREIDRSRLGQLDGFYGASEELVRENLNIIFVSELALYILLEFQHSEVLRMSLRLAVRDSDDSLSASVPAASCQCKNAGQDKQNRRHPSPMNLFEHNLLLSAYFLYMRKYL